MLAFNKLHSHRLTSIEIETLDVIISRKICASKGMNEFTTSRLFNYYPNFTGLLAENY